MRILNSISYKILSAMHKIKMILRFTSPPEHYFPNTYLFMFASHLRKVFALNKPISLSTLSVGRWKVGGSLEGAELLPLLGLETTHTPIPHAFTVISALKVH